MNSPRNMAAPLGDQWSTPSQPHPPEAPERRGIHFSKTWPWDLRSNPWGLAPMVRPWFGRWPGFSRKLNGKQMKTWTDMAMNQYLLIPFLEGWTSIYQLFLCSPGVQGFDPLPYGVLWCVFGRFHPQISFETWKNPAGKTGIARIVGMNQNWAPKKIAWLTIRLLIDIL